MKPSKILLVDDEKDAVAALQFRLENTGYEVLTAENGAQALDIIRKTDVDLVLADFIMPEINGLELARLVKNNPNWHDTKIILFSCNSDPEFRRRAFELGALDYLPKEGGFAKILQRVHEVADGGRRPGGPQLEDSPEEQAYRRQLHSLAHSLVDMLRLAQLSESLPESAKLAIGSAQRLARDIERLSGAGSAAEEQPSAKTSQADES